MELADLVGRTLGEFTLREKIGQGAFGAVFRAVQPSLGREAVVKILQPKHGAAGGAARLRFLREARLASRLDHPFAAHIYAFGAEDDGVLWIAMELVRGTSLADLIKSNGPLSLDRAVPLIERICEVVENAHEHAIIHRDLKPANVMVVTRGGRLFPKLLDLGLAKLVEAPDEPPNPAKIGEAGARKAAGLEETLREADTGTQVTQRGAYIGTPLYMAPEQWTQGPLDARADQYALGCVAYECLTGKPPFTGRTVIEVARAHQNGALPPLPAMPEGIWSVLARATAKKAADRWESALRFAAALREAAGLGGDAPLPAIDEALRRVAQDAPSPIADAAAAIEAARNPHEARDAVQRTVRVTLRWLAIVGLAARTRGGVDLGSSSQLVADLVRELRKRDLLEADWVALVEALVKPYADRPEVHPLPELVRAISGGAAQRLAQIGETVTFERDSLAGAYGNLATLLREMTFLRDYPLVVLRGSSAEIWMGARRGSRPSVELAGEVPDGEGKPILADADRHPVLVLWPLAQVSPPSPGAPEELFLLTGHGRRGARLVAGAVGFERQDDTVWDYFRQSILDESIAESGPRVDMVPYRGLAPFTAEDARLYFGREREAEEFANRLKVQPLLVVAGPSGVGKSSFVQAGVTPSLPEGSRVVVIRPGATPLSTLHARLDAEPGPPALLVVDQFEELFTLCGDPVEREAFAAKLVSLTRDSTRVVLTVRDDFLARAAELTALRDRVTQGLHLLTTPAHDDLLRILLEPARRVGFEFEPRDLPERMVADVAGQPGALALLSFTASKLWESRDRHFRRLTADAYQQMGGVGGALARHADETVAALAPAEQRLVREAFRHLVTAEGTRAVLTPAELRQVLGGGAAAERVIEKLIGARLLVADDERVEIIHEALVVAWPRLVEWRHEDSEGSRFRDQLRTAVKAWEERGRPSGLLWRGDALADYQRWRAGYPGTLTEVEDAFASASEREAARARRNRNIAIALSLAALTTAVIVLLFLNRRAERNEVLAREQSDIAERRAAEARERLLDSYEDQGRQYFLSGDVLRAVPYLLEAWKEGRRGFGLKYLLARAREQLATQKQVWPLPSDPLQVTFSRDGRRVALAGKGGVLRVWSAETGETLLATNAHDEFTFAADFDPTGNQVISAGGKEAKVWDLATGANRLKLPHKERVYAASFSPDQRRIVTASMDGTVKVWGADAGEPLASLVHDEGSMLDLVTFTGDGARIISGDRTGRAHLWEVAGSKRLRTFAGPPGRLTALELSADEELLMIGGGSQVVSTWATNTGTRIAELRHPAEVTFASLSPDGATVITACTDQTVRLWDARTGGLLRSVEPGTLVRRVRFCGPSQFVTGGDDGSVNLWRTSDGVLLRRLTGHFNRVQAMDCTEDGRLLATAGFDQTGRLWALASDRVALPTGMAKVSYFDVDGSGRRWLVAGPGADAALWEEGSDQPVQRWPTAKHELLRVRLDPTTTRFVALTRDPAAVRVWAIGGSPNPIELLPQKPKVLGADWSPDGKTLAVSDEGKRILLWDPSTGRLLRELAGHTDWVIGVVYSPDGSRLASTSRDRVPRLWDTRTNTVVTRFVGHDNFVTDISYFPDGKEVVTGSSDRTVRMWSTQTGAATHVLEGHTAEIGFVAANDDLIASGARDGEVFVWERTSGRLLHRIHVGNADVLQLVVRGTRLFATTGTGVETWDISGFEPTERWKKDAQNCGLTFQLETGKLRRRSREECAKEHL